MAKTIGERAKQEAQAFKARAWFRGMESMAYGTGEWRGSDGKKLKMRHELREGRTQGHENHAQRRHSMGSANQQTLDRLGWLRVDSIALIGVYNEEERMAEIRSMLDVLERQTPDVFDRYDEGDPQRYAQFDVPDFALGAIPALDVWAESEVKFPEPKFD